MTGKFKTVNAAILAAQWGIQNEMGNPGKRAEYS
jgi:hypothetical protein